MLCSKLSSKIGRRVAKTIPNFIKMTTVPCTVTLQGTLAITIQPSKELSLGNRSRHGCSPPSLSSVAIAWSTLKTKAGECVVAGTHSVFALSYKEDEK